MSLIKSREAHRLAQQLARSTGESMTEAVTKAFRDGLERIHHERRRSLADGLLHIGKNCAAHLKERSKSIDHCQMLYDEKGSRGNALD